LHRIKILFFGYVSLARKDLWPTGRLSQEPAFSCECYKFSKDFQETEAFQIAPTKSVTEIQMQGPPSRRLTTEDGERLSSEALIDHRTAVCGRLVTESIGLPSQSLIP
jgi:hypothetical protein